MKKLFAMFMALAMIMGMPAAAFASQDTGDGPQTVTKPSASDKTEAQIQNVEKGVTIEAYRIVEPVYNDSGFVKYQAVNKSKIAGSEEPIKLGITDPLNPTYDQVMVIAKSTDLAKLESVKTPVSDSAETNPYSFIPNNSEDPNGLGTYKAQLGPGYWLVLVKGGKEVYNPMLLGVYYSVSGNDNTMTQSPVDANRNWTLESNAVVAKSSEVTIEKNADRDTQDLGGTVTYTVKTTVPYYSDEYETNKLRFKITDTLTGLELVNNRTESDTEDQWAIKVYSGTVGDGEGNIKLENQQYKSGGTEVTKGNDTWSFEGTTTASKYKISFASQWIKNNGGKDVVIVYSAKVTDAAKVNYDPHNNKVELSYTNDPSDETEDGKGKTDDEENVYTFEIDGTTDGITKDLIKKVAPGKTEETKGKNVALKDAEFTLYKKYDGTPTKKVSEPYTNTTIPTGQEYTAKSDEDGQLKITGLAEGTYYLKETKAPSGYTLNDNIYKIEITNVEIENKKLKSWDVVITEIVNGQEGTPITNSFSVNETDGNVTLSVSHKSNEGTDTSGVESTNIHNTEISSLPSTGGMGTTIFTIGGCIIMITAAGLFFASRRKTSAK